MNHIRQDTVDTQILTYQQQNRFPISGEKVYQVCLHFHLALKYHWSTFERDDCQLHRPKSRRKTNKDNCNQL